MAKSWVDVAGMLRERINDGIYPPGSRLPTRTTLEKELDTSSHTLQRALDDLITEGYVVTRKWEGSFISESPPHLSKICLFMPASLEHGVRVNRFYRSIVAELPVVARQLHVSFEILECAEELRNWEKVQRLVEDVRLKRLAGILFLAVPGNFAGTPIYDAPGIARVALSSESVFGIPAVTGSSEFYSRALGFLAENGARRPAVIIDTLTHSRKPDIFPALFHRYGLEFCPQLLLAPPSGRGETLTRLIRIWHSMPESQRPDSLVVYDDNRLNMVTATLCELNWLCNSPKRIVALANYPWVPEVEIPLTFLGFETDRVLELCTRSILAQCRGENVPLHTALPALFEHELNNHNYKGEKKK